MPSALDRALARFRRRPNDGGDTRARSSAAQFRAVTEQRLHSLEREVAEVKGRVNGLIFVVAGAAITLLDSTARPSSPAAQFADSNQRPHRDSDPGNWGEWPAFQWIGERIAATLAPP